MKLASTIKTNNSANENITTRRIKLNSKMNENQFDSVSVSEQLSASSFDFLDPALLFLSDGTLRVIFCLMSEFIVVYISRSAICVDHKGLYVAPYPIWK